MRNKMSIMANVGIKEPQFETIREDEIVEIKGVFFRIARIDTGKVILRFLPKNKQAFPFTIT